MINIKQYTDKTVAVFGLGKAGLAAAKALHTSGATIFAWDDDGERRSEFCKQFPSANLSAPNEYDWSSIAALILSPGIALTHPEPHQVVTLAKEARCPIICDVELLYISCPNAGYIGVTGTNGKSTTTALIGHILLLSGKQASIGGNIGTAATALPPLNAQGHYVLEVSSYQLDLLCETRFNIAVLLNITPDHLDRHGGMEGYIASKQKIFANQGAGDIAVIAVDDSNTESLYEWHKENVSADTIAVSTSKSLQKGVYMQYSSIHDTLDGKEEIFDLGELKHLPGKHNAQNIVVAYAVAKSLGIDSQSIITAIKTFPGLKHRIELVDEINNIRFINDSKATNAVAAEKAIENYDNIYWIAGGIPKEGGIESLSSLFSRIKHSFIIGQAQESFASTLKGKVDYTKCATLDEAFQLAYEMASTSQKDNPVVLLSPACASFDQFENFEARGEAFCQLVTKIKQAS